MIGCTKIVKRSLFRERSTRSRRALLGPLVCVLGMACADGGKKVTQPGPPDPGERPRIDRLTPSRTVIGDTIRVEGSSFGALAAEGEITFAGVGGRVAGTALAWSDSSIAVLVPEGAATGDVSVRSPAGEGTGKAFSLAPRRITFSGDLFPLLDGKGCVDCHSGDFATNNLRLESVPDLLRGDSFNGPVVSRRNGPESIIVLKVSPDPPFGQRMPLGCTGACMSDEQILMLSDWIDQGTRND